MTTLTPVQRSLSCSAWGRLPESESGLIRMLANGMTSKQIARRIGYSEDHLKTVVRDVVVRWDAKDRTNLVHLACISNVLTVQRQRCATCLQPKHIVLLPLVAQGLTNAAIARRLEMPESTVKAHLKCAAQQLTAKNRVNLVYQAHVFGALPSGDPDA